MKSYTDLEQSKKLAEILPIESADMFYYKDAVTKEDNPRVMDYSQVPKNKSMYYTPCWSFAALFKVLPSSTLDSSNDHYYRLHCMERFTEWYDNPVDACVEMIIKLNELNLL